MPTADLRVKLLLSDQLKRGFQGAQSSVSRFVNGAKRSLGGLSGAVFSVRGALAGIGVALSARAIAGVVSGVADVADEIGKLSIRLGLSTEFLSEFRFVANQTGVETNTLNLALQRVTRRFGEIARTGKGTALPALQELGEDLVEAVKRGESFEKLLPTIAERLRAVEDPAKRLSIAFQLFDSEGAKLVQTLNLGADGIRRGREEAHKFGQTITSEAAKSAAEFNDEINRLKKTFVGFANEAILPLLPYLTDLSATIRDALDAIKDANAAVSELNKIRNAGVPQRFGGSRPEGGTIRGDPFTGRAGGASPGPGHFVVGADGSLVFVPEGPPAPQGPPLPPGFFDQGPPAPGPDEAIKDASAAMAEFKPRVAAIRNEFIDLNDAVAGTHAGFDDLRVQFSAFNVFRETVNAVGNAIADNVTTSLIEMAEGTKTVKEAFRDMAKSILRDLARIIIQALVARALGALVGSAGGGAGEGGADVGIGVVSGVGAAHGLTVPPGRMVRAVLHGGKYGEDVIPRGRPSTENLSGRGGQVTVINIAAIDVEDFDKKIGGSLQRQDVNLGGIVVNAARNNEQLRAAFGTI